MRWINCTKHAIDRVIKRTNKKTEKNAKMFLKYLYINLQEKSIKWLDNKWRKIDYWYLWNKIYFLTDWKHKIIFEKDSEKWEETIITYIDVTKKSYSKELFSLFKKLWINNKTLCKK